GQTSAGRGRTGDRARAGRGRGRRRPAEQWPIGRVLVDVSLAHLDRTFDYRVPEQLDTAAVPGVRVRVRFAGQLVDGFLLERAASSEHQGRIAFLERVTSSEPVLTAELLAVCRAVAGRYGGTLIDVVRLAVPPRHARAEAEAGTAAEGESEPAGRPRPRPRGGRGGRPGGAPSAPAGRFLAGRGGPRAAAAGWPPVPGEVWPTRLAERAAATRGAGRGAVLVVPEHGDAARVHAA